MKSLNLMLISLGIIGIVFLAGCSTSPSTSSSSSASSVSSSSSSIAAQDGTITAIITNAAAAEGKTNYFSVVNAGADPTQQANLLGSGRIIISNGTGTAPVLDLTNHTTPISFTGGNKYDVFFLMDMDGSGYMTGYTTGDKMYSSVSNTINGDIVVTVNYANFQ